LEIALCIAKYIWEQFGNCKNNVTLQCVTDLMLDNGEVIRSHPNYQGEGEWTDWVLHACGNSRKNMNGCSKVFQPE